MGEFEWCAEHEDVCWQEDSTIQTDTMEPEVVEKEIIRQVAVVVERVVEKVIETEVTRMVYAEPVPQETEATQTPVVEVQCTCESVLCLMCESE